MPPRKTTRKRTAKKTEPTIEARILIMTSDDYLHLLPGFAHQWMKYCGLPATIVYRNVEPKAPKGKFTLFAAPARYYDWSTSLLEALDDTATEFVLLGLEDYWLAGPVDLTALNNALNYMGEHDDVMRIDLTEDRAGYPHTERDGYLQAVIDPSQVQYVLSTQFSLWRKDFLQRCLKPGELGPQFEVEASRRVAHEHPVILGTGTRLFPCHGDGVVWNGKTAFDQLHLEYLDSEDVVDLQAAECLG